MNASKTGSLSENAARPESRDKNATASPTQQTKQDPDAGKPELAAALARLNGDNGTRDTTAAVKLLWAAVAKGNTGAEATPGGPFTFYGDGVDQNCELGDGHYSSRHRKAGMRRRKKVKLDELNASGCPQ